MTSILKKSKIFLEIWKFLFYFKLSTWIRIFIIKKIFDICADSGANIQAAIRNFDCVIKIRCESHRLNLSVNDIFNVKWISEKSVNGKKVFAIRDLNEEGNLCTIIKKSAEKETIDNINTCITFVNELVLHSSQLQNKL